MELFWIVESGAAIIRQKGGKYGQEKLYARGKELFVGIGKSYYRLERKNDAAQWTTSNPNIVVIEFMLDLEWEEVKGRPTLKEINPVSKRHQGEA